MTTRQLGWTIRTIDLVGAVALGGCISVFVWLMFIQGDRYAGEVSQLRHLQQKVERDKNSLIAACHRQRERLDRQGRILSATGRLPDHPPVEEYFQYLSGLVSKLGLKVLRHYPLPTRVYPGLVEHRFAYELSGAYADLMKFLKAVEDSEFSADISYLKLDGGNVHNAATGQGRAASLTISMFSAPAAVGRNGST